jgi:hypothetical protein
VTTSTEPRTFFRGINTAFAVALCAVVLGNYLPMVRVLDLSRAGLGIEGEWIDGPAKRITSITPGAPADRAGLRAGDVLLFDPNRESDWVLAGYRNMPEGFSAALPVRHADGSQTVVSLVPTRVTYLPTLNDKLALLARLAGLTLGVLIGVFMVWARPGLMTWSLLIAYLSLYPTRVFADYYLGFAARAGFNLSYYLPALTMACGMAFLPFALTFPRNTMTDWPRWRQSAALVAALVWTAFLLATAHMRTFSGPVYARGPYLTWVIVGVALMVASLAALARTYRRSDASARARLKWALLGLGVTLVSLIVFITFLSFSFVTSDTSSGSQLTPGNWLFAVSAGILFPVSFGYAVLRERVVDVQFAVSRTVVYGLVSTLVVLFIAVLHWLLGRMIEHSRLAFGLEGLAAVGLGLVLHRASHRVNTTVDRVLFRRHHAAEQRLRQVTAALPFATTEQGIAEAIVVEPAHNLALASAALFYRESAEGPLRRVLSIGWGEAHAASLDPESLLVRYLQAEHAALRLEDEQQWLPPAMPEGVGHPVLAIPVVSQHVLNAVVLYGSHVNGTLPDPDEVALLEALAKAAATSHQQVRIATLTREKAAAERESELQRARNAELESALRMVVQGRV